jgi:hypothetical protein
VKIVRALVAGLAVSAAGCLWLFPIEKQESNASATTGASGSGGVAGGSGSAGAAGSSVAAIDAGECTVNSDCGQDYTVCRASTHTCVDLQDQEACILVKGNWNDPNAFIFGAFATEPPGAPEKSNAIYNYELALNEINAAGGLPESQGDKRHPLAAVICNNDPKVAATDPNFYTKSLNHLVDDLGVLAIVADLAPDQLIEAFQSTKKKGKKVFFLSPGAANNALVNFKEDEGLVWNMIGPPADLVDGYVDLVRRIETYVTSSSDAGSTSMRVATVLKDDPSETDHELLAELYGAVLPRLAFNSKSAQDQLGGNYREFRIGSTADAGTPTQVGDAINSFAPHLVISMTGTDFTTNNLHGTNLPPGVAQRIIYFATGGPGRDLWANHNYPFFILSPINVAATSDLTSILQSSVALQDKVIYQRLLGINVAGADDRDVYNEYRKRLGAFNKDAGDGFENYYDSIYYLAYAVYAAGVESVDAPHINAGMSQLSSGPEAKVGSIEMLDDGGTVNLIENAFALIKQNSSVQLFGAGGSEFENSSGVRIDKAGLFCYRYNNDSVPIYFAPAEIFDPKKQKWTSFNSCAAGL